MSCGNLIYLFLTPFFYWIYFANTWHDASHFSLLTNKYLENIFYSMRSPISSCKGWYYRHTYLHHSYTNILNLDKDIMGLITKSYREVPNKLYKSIKNIFFRKKITTCEIIEKKNKNLEVDNITSNDKFEKFFWTLSILFYFRLVIYNFLIIYNYSFFNTLLISIIPIILFIILFISCSQINHIHENNFDFDKNFYRHQILTSHNVCSQSLFTRILTGGLNCQIEHHLFPSINSYHLPNLAKIIKPLCYKYNINYSESSSIFKSVIDAIKTFSKFEPEYISKFNFKID